MNMTGAEETYDWQVRSVGTGASVYYIVAAYGVTDQVLVACAVAERHSSAVTIGWHLPPSDLAVRRDAWEEAAVRALERSVSGSLNSDCQWESATLPA